jgi:pimeloyl-ACP methyl ester carboxylesterase
MISVDRPGFGYSEFGKARNLAEQSRLIVPLLDLLENKKPIYVIGHSLGAPLAIKLEADRPGTFAGIVLLAGSVDPSLEKPEKWRPWLTRTPLQFFVPGAWAPSNEELWYLKKDLLNLKGDFEKIKCPVRVVHGDKDPLVPVANVSYARAMLINSRHVDSTILGGANHFIPWRRYDEVKAELMKLSL